MEADTADMTMTGAEAAPAPEAVQETGGNPFDFSNVAAEAPEPEVPAMESDAPYVLDLGADYDGGQEITDAITQAAQANGLPAEGTGKFIQQVCTALKAEQDAAFQAGISALQTKWGANYDANMKGAGQFLSNMAARLGLDDAEKNALMNPAVFKLAHALRQAGMEKAAAGTTGADTRTNQQKFDALMTNPEKRAILMNPLHEDYAKVAAEANSYLPSKLF